MLFCYGVYRFDWGDGLMDEILLKIAKTVCLTGGIAVALTILWLVFQLCCEAWMAASDRFRNVLSGESMIWEYKKNRKKFLEWKESKSHEIVRHAEWEWFDELNGNPLEGQDRDWGWRCSVCKTALPDDYDDPDCKPKIKYCPECGAKMDGGSDKGDCGI